MVWIFTHDFLIPPITNCANVRSFFSIRKLSAPRGKELGESEWVRSCANRKPNNDFLMPLNTKFCSICRRLVGMSMINYGLPIRPRLGGNGVNQNVVPTLLFDIYTHYGACLAPFGHNTRRGRQTDDRIGRPCYKSAA